MADRGDAAQPERRRREPADAELRGARRGELRPRPQPRRISAARRSLRDRDRERRAPAVRPARARPRLARAELALDRPRGRGAASPADARSPRRRRRSAATKRFPHLLEAAERACAAWTGPRSTPDYVARIAPSRQQQTIWRLPDGRADPPASTRPSARASTAAVGRLADELRALQRRFPPRGKIALTGHAHIDLAWLWPYDETRRKLRRTFHTALSLMERSPDFRFNQSTAHYYAQIEEDDPELFAAITARVATGSWEPSAACGSSPTPICRPARASSANCSTASAISSALSARARRVCWLPDCFGFSPALPQLLRQAGIDSFFTIKVNWSETNKFPHDLFWWEGLDGSRVLAHAFDNPLGGYNGDVRPEGASADLAQFPRQGRSRRDPARRRLWRRRRRRHARDDRARAAIARLPRAAAGALVAGRGLLRARARDRAQARSCRSGRAKSISSCIARR